MERIVMIIEKGTRGVEVLRMRVRVNFFRGRGTKIRNMHACERLEYAERELTRHLEPSQEPS